LSIRHDVAKGQELCEIVKKVILMRLAARVNLSGLRKQWLGWSKFFQQA